MCRRPRRLRCARKGHVTPRRSAPSASKDVGVVQAPVDGRDRDAVGHQIVEPVRLGRVNVGPDRDRSFLICGVDRAAALRARLCVARCHVIWERGESRSLSDRRG